MTGNAQDLEKQAPAAHTSTEQSDHHDHGLSPTGSDFEKDILTKETQHSLSTSHSRTSVDTDPLSPLENALARPLSYPEIEQLPPDDLDDDDDEDDRDGAGNNNALDLARTRTSITSAASRPPDYEVTIEADDPENPKNWPLWYRAYTVLSVSYATWVVVLYSTSYTATIPGVMAEFGITSRPLATLGLTTYLLGLAAGSVVVAPMSELYGRRIVYMVCLGVFTVLIIPCGLANSLASLIVVRFIGAFFGAAMISNSPGTIVDIANPETLALCMSWYSVAPLNGPVTGPLIGGFVYEDLGWRWGNWLAMILAGVAVAMVSLVKETYMPKLLTNKVARLRKETGDDRWWCAHDQRRSTLDLLKTNLSRPFVLAATEPILWFFNIWISIIYGILYLCFVAYPIVFTQYRGWSVGMTGLAFLGIGIGTLMGIAMEPVWRRLINNSPKKDPETGRAAPEATAIVMCIGALLTPLGQLVFSWTCLPATIHPAIPIAFGIPFGMGNTLSFIYGSNYLAGAYGIYAASAMAGNAVMRSIFGAALPLAGPAMYAAMTPQWAGTFLGLLEVLLIPIPFAFYKYGDRIRDKSRVIRQMRAEKLKAERRAAKLARRKARAEKAAADAATPTTPTVPEGVAVDDKAITEVVMAGEKGEEAKADAAAQGARMA
ncbi:major facilitator superfamily domain-containing protein [Dichotomopilus funicola]|uniref:Major facilitator superfamily domain-containing protein n=1 Tax=Dichotomopilus funicola TaxID=1934379 RepID=A0AAN6V1E4_9PEZI|nr:major facilitator superfamily domain-containing protein [Dichotomopilus funicola]